MEDSNMQRILKYVREIGWFLISWALGGLFIIGGISEFFSRPLIGIGGIIIGVALIRAWFKRNTLSSPAQSLKLNEKNCTCQGRRLTSKIVLIVLSMLLGSLTTVALKDLFHCDAALSSFAGLVVLSILISRFIRKKI